MARENEVHPLTKHLREERGMMTRGWARFNGFNPDVTALVVYTGYYDGEIVKKLREEGLYDFLYKDVRTKIEEAEKAKGILDKEAEKAKGVTNGNS